jgi:HSP20 family protein
MANFLVKRDDRDLSRSGSMGYRWDPFRTMDALLRWDPFSGQAGAVAETFAPRFDVKETKDGYLFKADLPGVKDEDLDISLNGNVLTISGKRDAELAEEGEQYYAMERTHGSFARTFALPDTADGDHVTAELKTGVLTVHVAKRPEAQPKKIAIGKGSGQAKA